MCVLEPMHQHELIYQLALDHHLKNQIEYIQQQPNNNKN